METVSVIRIRKRLGKWMEDKSQGQLPATARNGAADTGHLSAYDCWGQAPSVPYALPVKHPLPATVRQATLIDKTYGRISR